MGRTTIIKHTERDFW